MWCGRRKPSAGSCRGQSHPPEVCEVYFSVKIHLGLRKTSSNSCSTLIFRTTRNDWRCPQCKPQLLYPLPSPSRVSLLWNLFFPISIVIEFLWRKYNVQCNAMYSLHPNVHCSIVFEVQFQTKLFYFFVGCNTITICHLSKFHFKYCLENKSKSKFKISIVIAYTEIRRYLPLEFMSTGSIRNEKIHVLTCAM